MMRKVLKRWGYYVVLNKGVRFKTKLLVLFPGKQTSLQYHKFRSERWIVVEGKAKIFKKDRIFILKENYSVLIHQREVHCLKNPYKETLKIIEVQYGDILKESDIKRITR